jgi:hypothetical protein
MQLMGRDITRIAAIVAALVLGLAVFSACATTPRTDREWYDYLAPTSHVQVEGETVTVGPVSDWTYDASGAPTPSYSEASFDVADLKDVWFLIEPQPGSRLAAHTLLLFEFEGDRIVGLTIEARREADEEYSAFRGLWNQYELSYLWGSARDLLTRRAVMLGHEVFVYPLALQEAQKRMLIERLLERTEALETKPRFYNTMFSNCTNELAKAAGLKWHYSFILTGRSDEYLFRRGVIPGESFEDAHARADVTEFVRSLNGELREVDFDAALLAELRARRDAEAPPTPTDAYEPSARVRR